MSALAWLARIADHAALGVALCLLWAELVSLRSRRKAREQRVLEAAQRLGYQQEENDDAYFEP